MTINHVLILISEPKSIFLEILFKYFNSSKHRLVNKKITLVGNLNLIQNEAKTLNFKKKFTKVLNLKDAKKNQINVINIELNKKNSSTYISKGFYQSLSILKENKDTILFNGPVNKKTFLKKKYLGVTEYLANQTNSKYPVMLIYNDKISVSPITTHLPIKHVAKNINKKKIIQNIDVINNFYQTKLKKKPKIAILGLNPHCESIEIKSEEDKEIIPAIRVLKNKKIDVNGPFSADTFFLKKNINEFDVVVGMYHDQVLTPLKTLFNFNAINITLGLPFIRVSPDHGPNTEMYGKNKSDPSSIFCAMKFFNTI